MRAFSDCLSSLGRRVDGLDKLLLTHLPVLCLRHGVSVRLLSLSEVFDPRRQPGSKGVPC